MVALMWNKILLTLSIAEQIEQEIWANAHETRESL